MNRPDLLSALAAHPRLPAAGAHALIDNGLRLDVLSTNPHLRPEVRDRIWDQASVHTSIGGYGGIDFYTLTIHTGGDPARVRRAFDIALHSGDQRWSSIIAGLLDVGGHDDALWDGLADTVAATSDPIRRRQLAQRLMCSDAPTSIRRRLITELSTESQLRFLVDHPDGHDDATAAAWPAAFGSLGARTVWSYGLLRAARPDIAEAAAARIMENRPVRRGDLFALVALTGGGPWPGLDVNDEPWHNSGLAWSLLLADPDLDPTLAETISTRHHSTDPWDRTRSEPDLDVAAELITAGAGWLTSTRLAHLDELDAMLASRPLDTERRDMWDIARRAATRQRVGVAPVDRIEVVTADDDVRIDTATVDDLIAALGDDPARWRLAITMADGVGADELHNLVDLAFDDTSTVTAPRSV